MLNLSCLSWHLAGFELRLSFYYGFLPLEENVIMTDLHGSSEFNGLLVNWFFRLVRTYEFNPGIVKILKIYLMLDLNQQP